MISHFKSKSRSFHRLISFLLVATLIIALNPAAFAIEAPTPPSVRADSAIVMDFDTGDVLYEKDIDTMRVPASMTKVMTAYIIFEELEKGNLTLDTMVPISEKNARISRDSSYPTAVPLPAGSSQSVDTLIKLILIPSASASCIVMAEYISGTEEAFVQRMNETAQRLGIAAAYQNCHGARVHYISARGQATLVRAFIQKFPQILTYTSMTPVAFDGKTYSNTNKLLPGGSFAYSGADGFKTGTISAAGYCLSATAMRGDQRVISVVMHSDNTTTRHTDSQALLDYGFKFLEQRSIFPDITYHWSRTAVEELEKRGVELYTDEGENFLPDQMITRGEFTAMITSAMTINGNLQDKSAEEINSDAKNLDDQNSVDTNKTSDVVSNEENSEAEEGENSDEIVFYDISGHWAEEYILKAAALGMVTGKEKGYFFPNDPITRQEIMVLIDRFLSLPDENGLGFVDDDSIALWALVPAARVTASGLFLGNKENYLRPTQSASRGEAATLVSRMMDTKYL